MRSANKQMAERASQLFQEDFKQIEARVPKCFRSNPGGTITPARRKKALEIIERVERYNRGMS